MGVLEILAPMTRRTPPQADPCPPSSPLSKLGSLITLGAKRTRIIGRRGLDSINIHYYIHLKEATNRSPYPQPSRTVELTVHINELV